MTSAAALEISIKQHLNCPRNKTAADRDFGGNMVTARDDLCRKFFQLMGLSNTVNNLESMFSDVHYFPVSAIEHSEIGKTYEPIRVPGTYRKDYKKL